MSQVKVARSRHQEWSGRKWVVKMMGWLAVRAVVRVVSQALTILGASICEGSVDGWRVSWGRGARGGNSSDMVRMVIRTGRRSGWELKRKC